MRAEGNGWVVFQPSDDEDEAVVVSIRDERDNPYQPDIGSGAGVWPGTGFWAERTFTQPEALKLYRALGDALGNMTPKEKQ